LTYLRKNMQSLRLLKLVPLYLSYSKILPTIFILLSLNIVVACSGSTGVSPGEIPPDFNLSDLEGNKYSPKSFVGNNTILSFWASWCEPCIRELPALERLHSQKSNGINVVSIGIDDSLANLKREASKAGVTFPVLIDSGGVAKRRYRVSGVPETFLLGASGKLVFILDENGKPSTRLLGPREWDSKDTLSLLKQAFLQDLDALN
jgi:thiol-disulfide isomerase/thioredoxin